MSVDAKAYAEFVKRATGLLDKLALNKDSVLLVGEPVEGGQYQYRHRGTGPWPEQLFSKPALGESTPRGYAIWLVTFVDGTAQKMRWNLYWVDADLPKSVNALPRGGKVKLQFNDAKGELITEDEADIKRYVPEHVAGRFRNAGYGAGWLLCNAEERQYRKEGEQRTTISVFIAPAFANIGVKESYPGPAYGAVGKLHQRVKMTDAELERVKEVKASVEFTTDIKSPKRR